MKLPSTCAKCDWSGKTIFLKGRLLLWDCREFSIRDAMANTRIPCRPGQLPRVPKWCPRRKT